MIPTSNPVLKMVWNRMHKENKNWLCIICGGTGTGKSYTALRLASLLDPEFNVERVVFSAEEFMELLNSRKLKRGNIIIWDEAGCGTGLAAREWLSISNKAIDYVLQSFRHLGIGVIMTVPSLNFIDAHARQLFHTFIRTVNIIKENNICIIKWYNIQNNPKEGENYYKYPRFNSQRFIKNRIFRVEYIYVKMPEKGLIEEYEKKKVEFSQSLRLKVENDIKGIENKKQNTNNKTNNRISIIDRIVKEILEEGPENYFKKKKNDYDPLLIAAKKDVSNTTALIIARKLRLLKNNNSVINNNTVINKYNTVINDNTQFKDVNTSDEKM